MAELEILVPDASRLSYIGFHNDLGTHRTQEYKRRLKQWADSKPAVATWISPRSKETVMNDYPHHSDSA